MSNLSFVLDASMTLSWAFADERTTESTHILATLGREGAEVPAIWPIEMANAIAMAVKRGRLSRAAATEFLEDLAQARINVWPAVKESRKLFESAIRLGLTAYDASYVELASSLGLSLATLDKEMRAAARHAGVKLLG